MPFGSEIILGWTGFDKVCEISESLGLTILDGDNYDLTPESKLNEINKTLSEIYPAALLDIPDLKNCKLTKTSEPIYEDRYFVLHNPPCVIPSHRKERKDGGIVMAPWDFMVYYDPYECRDHLEEMCIGVSLTSMYFPTYLDWDYPSGSSGRDIVLTPELLHNIETARKHLSTVLPVMKDALICIKNMFY